MAAASVDLVKRLQITTLLQTLKRMKYAQVIYFTS